MDSKQLNNPWKGLNFYLEGEIIYGRNAEIQSLSQYIFNNTQTVLYGQSGIGKSSILNAGIFPKARLEGMIPVSIRLKHDDAESYIWQIRAAIKESGLKMKSLLPSINGKEHETLWEFMHRHTFYNEAGEPRVPLLVFDQFEEIFTLQKNENTKRDFFRQLGHLLNDVKPDYIAEKESRDRQLQSEDQETEIISTGAFKGLSLKLNIRRSDEEQSVARYLEHPDYHIVFAMREDFLSSLELYASSIPVMKDNRFGLLPINEEQAADIIRLPREGLVNDEVTTLIIEQVTNRDDFELDGKPEIEVDAAVLSLFLSRLYVKKPENEPQITAELVHTYSGHIIHDFYVDSITSNEAEHEILSKETILLLENQLLTREGRRNNVSRNDLLAQGVTEEELTILIDKRKLLRQFNHGNDIRIEYIHDILCPVVRERKEQRELILQQEQDKIRQEEEKRRLQEEAEKKQRQIEEKAAMEKAKLEAAALRTKRRNRKIMTISASFISVILLVMAHYYFANIHIYKSYYSDFTRKNGWPIGIGNKLSEEERATSPLYYCLSHKGSKKPICKLLGIGEDEDLITDVEIMSSNPQLPHRPRVSSFEVADIETEDAKAIAYNELLSRIHKLHFVGGENDMIEKEVALNEKDSTLFIVTYFHINNSDMWGKFLTPEGQSMLIRDNGIDRMKISVDSIGRIRSLMYYEQYGVRLPINRETCGFSWNYSRDGKTIRRYLLDQFSLPVGKDYNMVITQEKDNGKWTRYRQVASVDDTLGVEMQGPEGFSKLIASGNKVFMYVSEADKNVSTKIIRRDKAGNILTEKVENNRSPKMPTLVNYSYDKDGALVKLEKWTKKGSHPFFIHPNDNYLYEWEYLNGRTVKEIRHNPKGVTFRHTIVKRNNVTTETFEKTQSNIYIVKVDSTFKDGYSTSYYGKGNLPINYKMKSEEDSISFHRKRCVKQGDTERRYFYVYEGVEKKAPLTMNKYGTPISYYCKEIRRDGDGNVVSYKKMDEQGRIVKSMMFITQNGQVIGRAAAGIDGTPVRCEKWEEEGYCYYKIFYNKDFEDKYVSIQAFNEWRQKSVFFDSFDNEYQTISYPDFKGLTVNFMNREHNIVRSYKQFVMTPAADISQFNYPYLHILDKESPLYKAHFKDGDRIVTFGKWTIGNSFDLLAKEWAVWNGSDKTVSIEILRPTSHGTLERIQGQVKCLPQQKDLQEYHILALTNSEYEYLNKKKILK